MLPKSLAKKVPRDRLMTEEEWRGMGIQQSQGWQHYMTHKPGAFAWQ
jgi:cyclin-dependent kinase regulatory subunit CKS1